MRRRIGIILGLIAAGAGINLALAWFSALAADISHGRLTELYTPLADNHHWEVYRWDNLVGTRVFSRIWVGPAPGPYNHGRPQDLVSDWCRLVPPDPAAPKVVANVEEGWGFPLRSMSCRVRAVPVAPGKYEATTSFVIRLTQPKGPGDDGLYLPARPIVLGFAANTALFALVVVVAAAVTRDVRRALRRIRNEGPATVEAVPPRGA